MTEQLYNVWFVPTDDGTRAFKWVEHQVNDTPMSKDDADMEAYLLWVDDPAPDKADYYKVVVRPCGPVESREAL